ncbi:MAG: rubredoxin [Chitinophagaceae bacterium]
MARKFNTIKINKRGGVVPAGDLLNIVRIAREAGADALRFGTRQQIFFKIPVAKTQECCEKLRAHELFAEVNEESNPNIVSSFAAENVFHQSAWLREGDYRDIMDAFAFRPTLKVNLVDKDQCFVPFFTGHLNFITASLPNYWYLRVRFPKSNQLYQWPGLIYSYDIPLLCAELETLIAGAEITSVHDAQQKGELLVALLAARKKFITQPAAEELQLPDFRLPYYEGFNTHGQQTWLGIYRRNETFPLTFLEDIAALSAQCCITPWKSLIIKNINPADRRRWDYVLGKHRINVRHASNELNWMVEDGSEEGLMLKRMLVHHFDKEDLRTYGLCFAIKTKPKSGLTGSVVIRRQEMGVKTKSATDKFDILYTKDFNPNTRELVLFRSRVGKEEMGTYLSALCKYYYELQHSEETINHKVYREGVATENTAEAPSRTLHQCPHCRTVYDPEYGDAQQDVAPGTMFRSLPENYTCPTCEARKTEFVEMNFEAELTA